MPPKQTFTKDKIVDAALTLMRREGFAKLTARSIAKELGSSTMPVYSTIESMEKLKELIFIRSTEIAAGFRAKYQTGDVLTKYALGHIMLAKEEKELFHLVWLDSSWDLSVINATLSLSLGTIREELIAEGKYRISDDPQKFISFIHLVWLFIRGIGVEVNLGTFKLLENEDDFVPSMTLFLEKNLSSLFTSYEVVAAQK